MPQIDLTLVFAILTWFMYGVIAIYVLVAVGLTMLAARLETKGGWMAWIPILNLYLLCRLARTSPVWILPALVPVLGLAVLAYLGARVARRLGMPAAAGVLWGVPFLGALAPIPMALGTRPLPEGATGGAKPRRPLAAGAVSVAVVVCLATMGSAAFWMTGRMTMKAPATAAAVKASLPKHTASTLTEFPLDTATTDPAKPTNVVTQTFAKPAKGAVGAQVKIQPRQLPPWVEPSSLPAEVESVAAADYVSAGNDTPVSVVTMVMRDEDDATLFTPPSAAVLATTAPGARATGIEVKNAEGETYRGYKISGSDSAYYAMKKSGTEIGVVISATDLKGAETADRLARNLGVGDGLLQDPDYAGLFGELPAAPGNAAWQEIYTFTEADIEKYVQMIERETANMPAEQAGEMAAFMPLIKQVRSLAPKRVAAGYTMNEGGTEGFGAAIISYGSSRGAWMAFTAAEMAKRLVPIPDEIVLRPVSVAGASGYFVGLRAGGPGGAYVLRHGGTIVGLGVGENATEDDLRRWVETYLARTQ